MSEPFTYRHNRPLGPMPVLRLERAPMLTPEYRGVTPLAAWHRARLRQESLMAHVAVRVDAVPSVSAEPAVEAPPRSTTTRSALASVVLILALVLGCVALTL